MQAWSGPPQSNWSAAHGCGDVEVLVTGVGEVDDGVVFWEVVVLEAAGERDRFIYGGKTLTTYYLNWW